VMKPPRVAHTMLKLSTARVGILDLDLVVLAKQTSSACPA
jgi:hypothetical protein